MSNKLTITVDDEVYQGLHRIIVPRRISRFPNDLERRHVLSHKLAEGYRAWPLIESVNGKLQRTMDDPAARLSFD